jgi:glyoxylase-like metal-dependent hydrolase (beta-lactamase superfamily II)
VVPEKEAFMRRLVVCALLAVSVLALQAVAEEAELEFKIQRLTDRVVIFTEVSPWESNHVVIVGSEGMVLVDPGHSALMARLIRRAVAEELGRDRFDYVIDTHGHWGHTWGNSGFPEALVVGHERAAESIEASRARLEPQLAAMQRQLEQARAVAEGLDPMSDEAREAESQRAHLERIVRGISEPGFTIQPPRLTFTDRMTLDLGDLTLEMVFLGSGHSHSDIAVMIPEEKVLLMGCFFLERGPLPAFGGRMVLDPDRWLEVFNSLLDDESTIEHVVLGQHSVWPRERLVAIRDYMAELWSGVRAMDAEGVDFDTAVERLPVPEELDFVREAGASEEELADYHRREIAELWRQLKESASVAVAEAIDAGGAEAGRARYLELVAGSDVYFNEMEFNRLGYRYLGEDRVDNAIAVFEMNMDRFPESWNVYDSLGEAHAARGDTERAIELYSRSVEINPDNANGVQTIERLRTE